jgi:periplasmic protein TonB
MTNTIKAPSIDEGKTFTYVVNNEDRLFGKSETRLKNYNAYGYWGASLGHVFVLVIGMGFAAIASPIINKEPPATEVTVITQEQWAALTAPPEPDLPLPEPVIDPVALDIPEEPVQETAALDLPAPDMAAPVIIEQPRKQAPPIKKAEIKKPTPPKPVIKQTARPPAATASAPVGTKPVTRIASAPPPSYIGSVVRKINGAKFYPSEARDSGVKGRVTIAFSIRRDGSVVGVRVVGSSGSSALDSAARVIVARAAPFGAFPDDVSSSQINMTAPIDFSIR